MTGLDEDRELDDFLARRSPLHRRLADRDHAEPSTDLDRLVLDQAREAIDVRSNTPLYRAPRWALPVALAATVVLAFAVVLNFGRAHQNTDYPTAAAAQELSAPIADNAAESRFAPTAPALAKAAPEPTVTMPSEVEKASDKESAAATASSAPAATPPLTASNAAGIARVESQPARSIGPAMARARSEVAEEAQATASGDAVAPAALAAEKPAEAKAKHVDPKAWAREIQQLRAAGRTAEADRELADFRKAFPAEAAKLSGSDPRPAR
jgi:hypothetical protein